MRKHQRAEKVETPHVEKDMRKSGMEKSGSYQLPDVKVFRKAPQGKFVIQFAAGFGKQQKECGIDRYQRPDRTAAVPVIRIIAAHIISIV